MNRPCPAMPPRPPRPLSALRWLATARDNPLAAWHQGAFVELLMHRRLAGRDLLVLNNPRDIRRVLVDEAWNYTKGAETRRALQPLLGDSLLISEGARWRRQRRMIAPLLTGPERLPGYEAVMIQAVGEMIARWEALPDDTELEMGWECTRLAAEVVSRALFRFPLGEHAATIFEAFGRYQEGLGRLDLMSILGLPPWLPRPGEASSRRAVLRLERVAGAIVEAARRRGDTQDDLLTRLMGEGSTPPAAIRGAGQLRDEIMLMLLAGYETTANALCWAFYLLSQDTRVRRELETEADRELGGDPPVPQSLRRLRYTRALVSEVLRLYPPIYQFSRQALSATRVGGRPVGAGSLLVISPWLMHRHHRFWRQPDELRPERFLQPGNPRVRSCYLPFGAGPRVCPGAGFAISELVCTLAMTARRFRLRLRPGAVVEPLGRLTLRMRAGLPMLLTRR